MDEVKLTAYSHGAGCGCKISPSILGEILSGSYAVQDDGFLLVGNHSRDDAAVYDIGHGQCLISTTDFFMPIVDDAFDFGRIAAANAISDVYAMGGRPILAIAILGWPIDKLSPAIARQVVNGARAICAEAGIQLAGGHSIDSPEPIFGLAVNGLVKTEHLKRNDTAHEGDYLFLTKKLGVGILTTAEKKGKLLLEDVGLAAKQMVKLNTIGAHLGEMSHVHALTDVTGFGLLGHLLELVQGSKLGAILENGKVPLITQNLDRYLKEKCIPGGSKRNWNSYGEHVIHELGNAAQDVMNILCDPQTSGGILISVGYDGIKELQQVLISHGLEDHIQPIGRILNHHTGKVRVTA